jgi:hypothetical protein
MSEEDRAPGLKDSIDERLAGLAAGVVRVMPAVSFGLRTAALAGLVVSVAAGAADLGGVGIIEAAIIPSSTCCP